MPEERLLEALFLSAVFYSEGDRQITLECFSGRVDVNPGMSCLPLFPVVG